MILQSEFFLIFICLLRVQGISSLMITGDLHYLLELVCQLLSWDAFLSESLSGLLIILVTSHLQKCLIVTEVRLKRLDGQGLDDLVKFLFADTLNHNLVALLAGFCSRFFIKKVQLERNLVKNIFIACSFLLLFLENIEMEYARSL